MAAGEALAEWWPDLSENPASTQRCIVRVSPSAGITSELPRSEEPYKKSPAEAGQDVLSLWIVKSYSVSLRQTEAFLLRR